MFFKNVCSLDSRCLLFLTPQLCSALCSPPHPITHCPGITEARFARPRVTEWDEQQEGWGARGLLGTVWTMLSLTVVFTMDQMTTSFRSLARITGGSLIKDS